MKISRRRFMGTSAAAAATAMLPFGGRVARAGGLQDKLLFVVSAAGGASIVDSFLPVAASQPDAGVADGLIVYPDQIISTPSGSNISSVGLIAGKGLFSTDYDLSTFLTKHGQDAVVMTSTCSSVNHIVAQKRAITGDNIDGGRTLQEAVAMNAGSSAVLPNCNMANGGYLEPGTRMDVPASARAEIIKDPMFFAASTHGYRGLAGAPAADAVARARAVRGNLDSISPFATRHGASARRQSFLDSRTNLQTRVEDANLIENLMMFLDTELPLAEYGLASSPMAAQVRGKFPLLADDGFEAQAALAFLLAYFGVSNVVTLGLSPSPEFLDDGTIVDTPLAFDYSHNDHVTAQNVSWGRMMKSVDGLVDLLKTYGMWDRSLIYVATDFGRDKRRPSGSTQFGTSHHLNNGNLLISPLLKGNAVYGGVNPNTLETYGFDPLTGAPDSQVQMNEGHVYSLVCQAMGVSFTGQHDMSGLVRG